MNTSMYHFNKKGSINYQIWLAFFMFGFLFTSATFSQEQNTDYQNLPENKIEHASVKIDGNELFKVRGVSSYTAEKRANAISARIKQVAQDDSFSIDSIKIIEFEEHSIIYANKIPLIQIFNADAEFEGLDRHDLAETVKSNIKFTIEKYRNDRSKPVLLKNLKQAGLILILLILFFIVILWVIKRFKIWLQKKIESQIKSVENISFNLIKSNHLWRVFHILLDSSRVIIIIFFIVAVLDYVLGLFPWTNAFAKYVRELIFNPLINFGEAFVAYIPKFIFIAIIFLITKYLLRLIKLFFAGIKDGGIVIKDFNAEWAPSTYKIVRFFINAFALVMAYPYIPGSDSVAFKGVSVFIGVIFSLGSSSFIGNLIAGYSMIYRNAFKIGDLIEVENQIGIVEEQKLLVTRLRTHKNEEIVLPNSVLLNNKITNYSNKAKESGIILHTKVGIGYETPWRQVDAMLKLAANRTEGLLKNPPPFVLKKDLADYAVNYEINAYCTDIHHINIIYSVLNQNILDVFNENNVQIMTPSYVADTEIPKVVPKDQWDTPLRNED
ncbi:mechanosensitive ion channel family protein [Xanthomarina sp.]|uniref:mechanosensitive ion channel family protein n=1 Tax=Xanthomarina sp. TaxID=1931211 RepID=UPI002C828A4B|nr:mechanosensitive ion channel domain-containing protein [Xanthomarina sp.]HLV38313.1 mechanosensitive ion channel domain-containing protein [Xanthomarina sp.]